MPKWTEREQEFLRREMLEGKSFKEIAEDHGRTVGAIQSRVELLGFGNDNGATAKAIKYHALNFAEFLGMDKGMIEQEYDKYLNEVRNKPIVE